MTRRTTRSLSTVAAAALAAATLLVARSPLADDAPDAATVRAAHRALVVAHVGPRAVTAGELEDRLSHIPRYQLRTFGRTGPEIAKTYFDKIFVRDVLLALGAEDKHLDHDISVEQSLDRMLSSATLQALLEQVGDARRTTPEEVQAYYDANRARFETKARVSLWRILCKTREEASSVLEQAKKDGTVQTFTQLARDHSIDRATNLRGGNLGFVSETGVSSEPGVTVNPALVAAAASVKDGELVPTPVQEGTSYAVVWRRGSTVPIHKTIDEARVQIEDSIVRQKREAAQKALLDRLHKEKVSQVDESLLGTFDVSIDDGTIAPHKRR